MLLMNEILPVGLAVKFVEDVVLFESAVYI
jgi:hypothetical protein